ncbi:DUF4232 domain-containing protein [Streptomyces sp. DSM 41982]|uniref:DUF4232 domain-containing protein n=1 Tax=Streptomyces evansiae TaxID=3075535 RepID=A0ABD5E6X2_9ACTN|nr:MULTISPECIES: DUF4232 domain-containing protein [unclassified Streptomyces]MDT0416967.1 DUF4232 domain-containing protein [Streptomyces sp. DSM 41982]SCD52629.1 Protein of unknown function [Streptomyces sp. SolWspMP-sol7th]
MRRRLAPLAVLVASAALLAAPAAQAAPVPEPPAVKACSTAATSLAVDRVRRPVNHLLLTLTNDGKRPCYAYGAPTVVFDDEPAVTVILQDSVPQAVVTLEPGDSAYAAIGLSSPGGPRGRTVHHLSSWLANRKLQAVGDPATLALPKPAHVDDSAFVTYWQSTPDLALTW